MTRFAKSLITALTVAGLSLASSLAEPIAEEQRDGVLDTAKSLIAAEEWSTAADTLQSLHESGHRSPETLEAQGVALARGGRHAEAKAAFLQALALDPSRAADIMDKVSEIEPLATNATRNDQLTVLAAVSPTTPLWLALSVSFWLTVIAIVARRTLFRHGLATLAIVIGTCFTLASAAALIGRSLLPEAEDIAVLIEQDTLRSVPMEASSGGPEVAAGAAAVVEEQSGEFTLVKQMNEPYNSGWVRSENLVNVLPES